MSDEDRIRALLTRAAELPDDVQAPVGYLLERGRRRRRLRAVGSVTAVAVVVAAALTLPAALRWLDPNPLVPVGSPVRAASGPTAAQLSHFRWSSLPPSPLGARSDPLLTWTGRYLIELGGQKDGGTTRNGAVYDSDTRRWRLLPAPHANVGLSNAVDVWTGRQLFVANGKVASCPGPVPSTGCLPRAGLYDPATRAWTYTLLPKQLDAIELVAAAWTGHDVILAGVDPAHGRLSVGSYDPATGRWTMITPRLPAGHPPVAVELAAAPGRVLLWSLWSRTTKTSKNGYAVHSGIDVLSLGRSGWSTITGPWPQGQTVDEPAYAGGTIFLAPSQIWCGLCSHPFAEFRSRLVNPATLAVTQIPRGPLATHPLIQAGLWVWTGRTAIAMNTSGQSSATQRISKLAAYDPATEAWHLLPGPPRAAIAQTPVWAGDQLLVLAATGNLLALHR